MDKNTTWLDDSNIVNLLTLGFVIYAALFVGKLWPKGMDLFKHPLVKILSFLAVAYLAKRNACSICSNNCYCYNHDNKF